MKTLGPWLVTAALVLAAPLVLAAYDQRRVPDETANQTRVQTPDAGAPSKAAATTSTPAELTLTADTVYEIICRTDAWWEVGTAVGDIAAAADDNFLPANAPRWLLMGGSEASVAISFLSVSVDGDCYATANR